MELRDLGYFQTLATELNFGRAARALHMTQPALSVAIARLERQVQAALFERTHRGVVLTPAGAVLLAETSSVLQTVERATELARRAGAGEYGSLVVGFIDAAVFDLLPRVLETFRESYPAVDLTLRHRPSSDLVSAVEDGSFDLAFVRPESKRTGVNTRLIWREPAVVALHRDSPLAGLDALHLADIIDQDFVFPESHVAPSLYANWLELCSIAKFAPRIVAKYSSVQVFVELIEQGIGIGFASKSWLRRTEQVVARPLLGGDASLDIALAYRPDRMSTSCRNFVRLAVQQRSPGFPAETAAAV
ncbi:MAG: hypothetical protein QOF87_1888 [Pseudonocardiales bacterium]|nr:hypothetical protein [Pseudonocardiales bacterium]